MLRLDALVDVVVSGEDHADAVLEEHRLQRLPLGQIRAVPSARRVERVVEVGNLPVVARAVELTFQPLQLLRVEIGRLEREEPHALLRRLERVVGAAAHVERLVGALLPRIVVAERGVELHAAVEQRLVWLLELVEEVLRPVPAIEVVADRQHQRERELRAHARHLLAELVLLALAGAEVSHHAELERVGLVRQRQRQRRRCRGLRRGLSGVRTDRCRGIREEPGAEQADGKGESVLVTYASASAGRGTVTWVWPRPCSRRRAVRGRRAGSADRR